MQVVNGVHINFSSIELNVYIFSFSGINSGYVLMAPKILTDWMINIQKNGFNSKVSSHSLLATNKLGCDKKNLNLFLKAFNFFHYLLGL